MKERVKDRAISEVERWVQEIRVLLDRYKRKGDREAFLCLMEKLEWPCGEEGERWCRLAGIDPVSLCRYAEVCRKYLFY